jgi:hypothetical protein
MVDVKDKETGEIWGKQNHLNFAYKFITENDRIKKKSIFISFIPGKTLIQAC